MSIFLKVLAIFVPVNALRKIFLNSLIGFKSVQYETLAKAITENVSKVAITFILMILISILPIRALRKNLRMDPWWQRIQPYR